MKEFISNYGDIILIVLVIFALICMVTPVGDMIKNGITDFIQRFNSQTQNIELPGESVSAATKLVISKIPFLR